MSQLTLNDEVYVYEGEWPFVKKAIVKHIDYLLKLNEYDLDAEILFNLVYRIDNNKKYSGQINREVINDYLKIWLEEVNEW